MVLTPAIPPTLAAGPRKAHGAMGFLTNLLDRVAGSTPEVASYIVGEARQLGGEAAAAGRALAESKLVQYGVAAVVAYKTYQLFFDPLRHIQRNHEVISLSSLNFLPAELPPPLPSCILPHSRFPDPVTPLPPPATTATAATTAAANTTTTA